MTHVSVLSAILFTFLLEITFFPRHRNPIFPQHVDQTYLELRLAIGALITQDERQTDRQTDCTVHEGAAHIDQSASSWLHIDQSLSRAPRIIHHPPSFITADIGKTSLRSQRWGTNSFIFSVSTVVNCSLHVHGVAGSNLRHFIWTNAQFLD